MTDKEQQNPKKIGFIVMISVVIIEFFVGISTGNQTSIIIAIGAAIAAFALWRNMRSEGQ